MLDRLTRRTLLTGGLGAAASMAFPFAGRARRPRRSEPFRVVHLTDPHLTPTVDCGQRFVNCLEKIQTVERPDMIFQGGDLVMDSLDLDREAVIRQWEFATALLNKHCHVPIEHCIGNHDVWGWNRLDGARLSSDPLYGKGMWLRWTEQKSTYRSFDRGGWHFVFLDSVAPRTRGLGYCAHLGREQFQWLVADLEKTPSTTPVCIVSHIPILSVAAQFFGPHESGMTGWRIPAHLMHQDARLIKDLFVKHPNVNLCLSGHLHMSCRVDYADVTHLSNGAVCGAWWRGPMQETKPGYGVVDFYPNGTFKNRYETY